MEPTPEKNNTDAKNVLTKDINQTVKVVLPYLKNTEMLNIKLNIMKSIWNIKEIMAGYI